MLRFFEPEAEPRWPVSGDPPEHHQMSRMLKLSGMTSDARLPLSSSLLTSSLLGSNNEDGERGPNFFTELGRFNYNGDLVNLNTSQDYNSFHLAALNQIPGQASLAHNHTGFRVPGLTSRQLNARDIESKKEKKHIKRESKRLKAAYYNNQQTPTCDELNTVATLTKVPLTARRSQKLGDKITALQQLVSPFGKTDTASVLQEACVYIKVLHEQIRVLSSPYFGTKTFPYCQRNGGESVALRANGLCLVPISPTIMDLTNQEPLNHRTGTPEQRWETAGVRIL